MKNIIYIAFIAFCFFVALMHVARIIYTMSGSKIFRKHENILSVHDKKALLIAYFVLAIFAAYKAGEYAFEKIEF